MKKHLLRIGDLSKEEILAILDRADELRQGATPQQHSDTIFGLIFLEASTRTRMGFHAAIARMGGTAITLERTRQHPGMTQSESLEDTIQSIVTYCDAFILRQPGINSIDQAARLFDDRILVNGGNGAEHPTQALIDLFAIRKWHGRLQDLRVGLAGDLARSRSAASFLRALEYFPPQELQLFYPGESSPPATSLDTGTIQHYHSLVVTHHLDVLYMCGMPRGASSPFYNRQARRLFHLDLRQASRLGNNALILCPLPRIDEIAATVDPLPGAAYFEQSRDAIGVRSAILEALLC